VATEQSSAIQVLLVDDDRQLGRLMSQFMAEEGFEVECSTDGISGLERAQAKRFDVILLDVGLPELDGFSVLHQMRRTMETPIVMLTSRSTIPDRLAGLNNGADDYLSKPFDPDELVARIRAVLRRYAPEHRTAGVREFGAIRIDEAERAVFAHGKRVEMTAIEYELLLMLSHSAGRVVTRDALTVAILDRQPSFFDRSLDVHVSRVRTKLGEAGRAIKTVRGEGYTLTAVEEKHVEIP
jgi:DNA-binding response OmpR family regulator